jgi:hypothetical protein
MLMALRIARGLVFFSFIFFAALFLIDNIGPYRRNQERAAHAKLLQDALAQYHESAGTFPIMPDNPVDDLRPTLEGFLAEIPRDPWFEVRGFQYRYASGSPNMYGLLFIREAIHWPTGAKDGGVCMLGLGTKGTGLWGEPPPCEF